MTTLLKNRTSDLFLFSKFIVPGLFLLISCTKNEIPNQNLSASGLIDSISTNNYPASIKFYYDNQGRVDSIIKGTVLHRFYYNTSSLTPYKHTDSTISPTNSSIALIKTLYLTFDTEGRLLRDSGSSYNRNLLTNEIYNFTPTIGNVNAYSYGSGFRVISKPEIPSTVDSLFYDLDGNAVRSYRGPSLIFISNFLEHYPFENPFRKLNICNVNIDKLKIFEYYGEDPVWLSKYFPKKFRSWNSLYYIIEQDEQTETNILNCQFNSSNQLTSVTVAITRYSSNPPYNILDSGSYTSQFYYHP